MRYTFADYQKAADAVAQRLSGFRPEIAMILGSGLGDMADLAENPIVIPYKEIPGFSVSTAPGHKGQLVFGTLAGKNVAVMQGRLHAYEGYTFEEVCFPLRVLRLLGCDKLVITNACGGVNLDFQVGDLMVIDDHINFMGANPLTGPNDAGFGPRFCDMTYAYTPALRRLADEVAAAQGVALRHGVYLGYMGPSYETPAEIRAFRVLGADAVGMSTVPEVIVASHCGLPVLAISLVTNMAAGVLEKKLDENEVIETAATRAKVLERLVTGIVERL